MFTENSRYDDLPMAYKDEKTPFVKLRNLGRPIAKTHELKQNHKLEILAHDHYADSSLFWHIADANTELCATELLKKQEIKLPTRGKD